MNRPISTGLFVRDVQPEVELMTDHQVGTREEWLAARIELLEQEKELTRRNDELARRRRELPWVAVEKEYAFETDEGTRTLAELFDGRSQLLVYQFMLGPDDDEGCLGCSYTADHFDGPLVHLNHHDVTFVCASRAPLAKINAYKRRMGWGFPWVSSYGTDFNVDFTLFTEEQRRTGAGFNFGTEKRAAIRIAPADPDGEEPMGLSAFALEDGVVYHTYSCFDRGTDAIHTAWQLLDRTPRGRFETPTEDAASGDWPRRHDSYEDG
jgi:predicted dithiol-disulfide oxidoreductase (DUF899 family)